MPIIFVVLLYISHFDLDANKWTYSAILWTQHGIYQAPILVLSDAVLTIWFPYILLNGVLQFLIASLSTSSDKELKDA